MGLTVAVVVLALTDRGMDLFQISLLFGVYSITTMAMELPFGGLADSIGRKPVFLMAVVASLMSIALFLATRDFPVLAISFACIGFGRALRSGTLEAWFVETFRAAAPGVDVQPALARAQWANAMGLAMGAVVGGILPDWVGPVAERLGFGAHDVSYAASFAVMLGVLVFTMVAIVEPPRPRGKATLWRGFATVPMVIRDAGLLAVKHPALSVLLAALAFFLMATNPVEVFWPSHAKPLLEAGHANTVIGAVTATYFFSVALGAALSAPISRLFRRRHALTLAAGFAGLAVLQLALAMQGGITGFVAVFILYSVILGLCDTPASTILHGCVDDHQRSTLLSLRSLVQQLGAALGLVLAGAVADICSTPVAWSAGAGFLGIAALLTLILARRLAVEPDG